LFDTRLNVRFPVSTRPLLVVTVDTEEEFDWDAEFNRDATQVTALDYIWRIQNILDEYGITPTYAVDHPVASSKTHIGELKSYIESNRAEIGAQLHAWVTPPYAEDLCARNSYQCNLPADLELEKLRVLKGAIEENFHATPLTHRAGRYGIGANTVSSLIKLGFEVDMSLSPAFDWRADGGPDFSDLAPDVFWSGPERKLLVVPNSSAFIGRLRALGPFIHQARFAETSAGRLLAGALSRTRMLEKIFLSPEGHTYDKLTRLTKALLAAGCRVVTFSLHSPTLKAGCTRYTSSEAEVEQFLAKCRRYFDFFFGEMQGRAVTSSELRRLVGRQCMGAVNTSLIESGVRPEEKLES